MKRLIPLIAMLLALLLGPAQSASAHVFFTDETGNAGVITHITPDDDPIAGSRTSFYFDIKSDTINTDDYIFRLNIVDNTGQKMPASVMAMGPTAVGGAYVFPVQGAYTLELIATPIYAGRASQLPPTTFTYDLRVTRGTVASPLDQPRYAWAEFGLVAGLCGIVVLSIVVISRRQMIAKFTKW